jgi:hypothetical protein
MRAAPAPAIEMPDFQPYSKPMESRLKTMERYAAGFAACLILSGVVGCSQSGTSELLNDSPSVQAAQANPDLTLPPDLRLPPPGAAPASAPPAPVEPVKTASTAPLNPIQGSPASAQPQGDIYDQYGISKVHADGTPKTPDELQRELKTAIIAKKRQQNPNYGTVYNFGNLFSGG